MTIDSTIDAIDSVPRLTVELVPQTCWFSNVRDHVSREDWDQMRSQVYESNRWLQCGHRQLDHTSSRYLLTPSSSSSQSPGNGSSVQSETSRSPALTFAGANSLKCGTREV